MKTLKRYSLWKIGSEKEDEVLTANYRGARPLREKLAELLKTKVKACDQKTPDYDCPSWSHKQAHLNGLKEAYQEVLNLITVEVDQAENDK